VGRAAKTIKLPKDKSSHEAQVIIPGDEIKCGFESISEFYSGHADGPSIIRYILGDRIERADQTKGIFLVHGDHSAREDLKKLIEETCVKNSKQKPLVSCPTP
jgi:predicted metal-dependent RNase